jgi:uncharacterized membrane-anchored protein YhcB (DUF1043 family)
MWPGITGVIIGILIGGTAVAIWLKRRGGSAESVAVLKRENAQFREEVNEHFVQTAELINQLTDSYKAVFDHLSEGAEKLVDPEVVRERMPQVGSEEVRLKRIGTVMASEPSQEDPASSPAQVDEPNTDEPIQDRSDRPEGSEAEPERDEKSEPLEASDRQEDPSDDEARDAPTETTAEPDKDGEKSGTDDEERDSGTSGRDATDEENDRRRDG